MGKADRVTALLAKRLLRARSGKPARHVSAGGPARSFIFQSFAARMFVVPLPTKLHDGLWMFKGKESHKV